MPEGVLEEPKLKSVSPYFTLVIQTDAGLGVTKLVLKGPKSPAVVKESATIGFYYKDGKYIFKIGAGEKAFDPTDLSNELKAFFSGANSKGQKGPNPVRLPNKNDLLRADGTFKTFESYELEVRLRATTPQLYTSRFPKLPRPLYEELVRFYQTGGAPTP